MCTCCVLDLDLVCAHFVHFVDLCGKPLTRVHAIRNIPDMAGYTKIFTSILDSTIWQESKETRLVWITMLAMKDGRQIVEASIPGLAVRAGVTTAECEMALERLRAPDPYSRTKDHEGRRIRDVDGGWLILNGALYREKLSPDERKEYKRKWQADYRLRKKTKLNGTIAGESTYLKTGTMVHESGLM